jgi:chromosome segregation ATPase
MRILCIACLVRTSIQTGAPGNEANGGPINGLAAIGNDLDQLGRKDLDLDHIKRDISKNLQHMSNQRISVKLTNKTRIPERLEKLKQKIHLTFESRVDDEMQELKEKEEYWQDALGRSKHSLEQAERKYQHALGFIKAKYESEIKGLLPRLHTCSQQRDKVASELDLTNARLYTARRKLQETHENENSTKKNMSNFANHLEDAVDADEQHLKQLLANVSNIKNDTRIATLKISELKVQQQDLQEALANDSSRLPIAEDEGKLLDAAIRDEERKDAKLAKQSLNVSSNQERLVKSIKDQLQEEHSSASIFDASKHSYDVQEAHMQDMLATRKARINKAHVETAKATEQLRAATDLLAKNKDVIAGFDDITARLNSEEEAQCKQELEKIEQEYKNRIAALTSAVGEAQHQQDETSNQNHQLVTQAEDLKRKIASIELAIKNTHHG